MLKSALWFALVISQQAACEELDSALFACDFSREEWRSYYHAYEHAAFATALEDDEKRSQARASFARELLERTSNITDILTCNVGVIAGYFIIA
eukprot:4954829-Amphidinium_carterae.2